MQTKSRDLKRTFLDTACIREKQWENNLYIGNFLRSFDVSNSDKLDVHAIVNVIFINKIISTVNVPTRLRSSTFELTGIYFRGVYFRLWRLLHHFGRMGWQKISFGPIRAQKCLISICSFNSIL